MKIYNVEIFGLERAMQSAGLPKSNGCNPTIPLCINNLGQASQGSGHDCFLKGIPEDSVAFCDCGAIAT